MGSYLRKPVVKPDTVDGFVTINDNKCLYGVSAIQGWRASMEDSYQVIPDLDTSCVYLGVFDGHGGEEVSAYLAKHLHTQIIDAEGFKNDHEDLGLPETFLKVDAMLKSEAVIEEMQKYLEEEVGNRISEDDEDDDGSDEDELEQLMEEASMSLEDVLTLDIPIDRLVKIANKGLRKENGSGNESADDTVNGEKPHKTRRYERFLQSIASEVPVSGDLKALLEGSVSDSDSTDSSDDECGSDGDDGDSCEGDKRESESSEAGASDSRPLPKRKIELDCGCSSKRIKLSVGGEIEGIEEEEEEGLHDPEGHESGSTAVVCIIRGRKIVVANTGDSRCVLSSKGIAVEMSYDHKPNDPLEQTRIEKAGGKVDKDLRVDGGLNLSRAFGDHIYKSNDALPLEEQMITALPDLESRSLREEDEFLLLASDGIWNCMESQEVVDFIRKKLQEKMKGSSDQNEDCIISDICTELCSGCLAPDTDNDGTGCDNMTVILVLLHPWEHLAQQLAITVT